MRLVNARFIDLAAGTVADPIDFSVYGGRLQRSGLDAPEEVTDLGGRFVIPGLWDAHTHFSQWAVHARRIDLSSANGPDEAIAVLVRWATEHPGEEPIIGVGARESLWSQPLDTAALDAATGDRVVVAAMFDLHSIWANSAALQKFGYGSRIDGTPASGVLLEDDASDVLARLLTHDERTLDGWVLDEESAAAAQGVVGVIDFEHDWAIGAWQRRIGSGINKLRVIAGTWPVDLERAIAAGAHTGASLESSGLLTAGPLKIISDGSLNSRTAWCFEPYDNPRDDEHRYGAPDYDHASLACLLSRAEQAGIDAAVHAIGDQAVAQALDCFAETGAHGSIEHVQLIRPTDVTRMAELGLRASVQPLHLVTDYPVMDTQWGTRASRAFVLRELLDAGVPLEFGSDAPVTPLDPWGAIQAAVLRAEPGEAPWHPEQAINLAEALCASTHGVRMLVPGAVADIAVLDHNPFELGAERLGELQVSMTMVAGRITYQN